MVCRPRQITWWCARWATSGIHSSLIKTTHLSSEEIYIAQLGWRGQVILACGLKKIYVYHLFRFLVYLKRRKIFSVEGGGERKDGEREWEEGNGH